VAVPLLRAFSMGPMDRLKVPLSYWEIIKRTAREAVDDDITSLAAQQAYYYFFALFPALLALVSIASFFPIENLVDEVVDRFGRFAPPEVIKIVTDQMVKIGQGDNGGVLTVAFLLTLWSSSSAILAMVTTLNKAYDIDEGRAWWKVRLIAIFLTIGLAIFILTSMALLIAGPATAEHLATRFGLGQAFVWAWTILQWPVIFALVASAIAFVYYFAPDAEQDWVWITPGSIVATILWVLVSLGLKFYLQRVGGFDETYGALGAVMVLMLWFYVSGLAILLGAELNAVIEHASPYGKAAGEKVPGQKRKIGALARRWYEEQLRRRRGRGGDDHAPAPA
jgi:membrane protein